MEDLWRVARRRHSAWMCDSASRRCRCMVASALMLSVTCSVPAKEQESAWSPDQLFGQIGAAKDVHTEVIGATWTWEWQRELASGRASGYWEASFGRWSSEPDNIDRSSAWVTQVGLTPVLRWEPRAWDERWFVEAGVGANVVRPVYRRRDKRFSTAFNFGDHVALGFRFGAGYRHELALRLQHFSNAGIKHPNPGENFVQIRYSFSR